MDFVSIYRIASNRIYHTAYYNGNQSMKKAGFRNNIKWQVPSLEKGSFLLSGKCSSPCTVFWHTSLVVMCLPYDYNFRSRVSTPQTDGLGRNIYLASKYTEVTIPVLTGDALAMKLRQ